MKKAPLVFAALILGFLVFQNAYSRGFKDLKDVDPSVRRLVLWRIYIQPPDSNIRINANVYITVTVDSVLRENFYTKEKFYLVREKDISELNPNTYYLVLAAAGCSEESAAKGKCFLMFPKEDCLEGKEKGDCILPDTQENREYLIKKWTEKKMPYKKIPPRIKGRDVDM
jgi:hypothetical protein